MSILEDLAVVRLPAMTSLVFSTDLFGGIMPTEPDVATSLFEYPGDEVEYVMGPVESRGGMAHPRIQVLVRVTETGYLAGRDSIEATVRALECANTTINGTFYERIHRLQDPFFLHRDTSRRIYFACNLTVTKAE